MFFCRVILNEVYIKEHVWSINNSIGFQTSALCLYILLLMIYYTLLHNCRWFTGSDGEVGTRGRSGSPGARGEQGQRGSTGTVGATGEEGRAGPTGQQGSQGEGGTVGERGEPGRDGSPGT